MPTVREILGVNAQQNQAERTVLQNITGVARNYLGFVALVSFFINVALLTVPI